MKTTDEQPTAPFAFTLWHRANRGDTWKPIATASTRDELIKLMDDGPPGEYLDLKAGQRP